MVGGAHPTGRVAILHHWMMVHYFTILLIGKGTLTIYMVMVGYWGRSFQEIFVDDLARFRYNISRRNSNRFELIQRKLWGGENL